MVEQEDVVKAVKAHFLAGSLLPGDSYYARQYHVHPVAYLGQTLSGSFVERDQFCFDPHDAEDDDDGMTGVSTWADQALACLAFDIEDSEGRRWPLLIEYRTEVCDDAPVGGNYGAIFHRHTLQRLGSIKQTDTQRGTLTLDKSVVDEVFANYKPHRFSGDDFFGNRAWGQTHPDETLLAKSDHEPNPEEVEMGVEQEGESQEDKDHDQSTSSSSDVAVEEPKAKKMKVEKATEPETEAAKTVNQMEANRNAKYWEISALACAGLTFDCKAEAHAAMFSAYHPRHIIQDFTRSMIRAAFDSAEVRPLLPSPHGMPSELIGLIGEYAPADLPHIRISSKPYTHLHTATISHQCVARIKHKWMVLSM